MLVPPKCLETIPSRIVAGVAGLALLVGCGGSGSSQGARTWTFGLGDLSSELLYHVTSGGQTITEYSDPAAPEATVLYMDLGDRYLAVNHTKLSAYPPRLKVFFVMRAYGRFYRGDPGIVTGVPDLTEEWLADAYATRVFYAEFGASEAEDCVLEMAALFEAGDANHPGSGQRAGYMQTILSAVIADEHSVPAPPGISNLLPPTGALVVSDVTGDMTNALIDNVPVGGTLPRGSMVLDLKPGRHLVGLYDEITGKLYWANYVTITNGKTTYTPF